MEASQPNTTAEAASAGRRFASLMLVATTFLWGLTFPLGKDWLNAAEEIHFPGGTVGVVLTQLGLRMTLATLLFVAWRPNLLSSLGHAGFRRGLILGLLNGFGIVLQVGGLALTTPALSVFLTSLASAWVPIVAFLFFRITSPWLTLVGLAIGMFGVAVLGSKPDSPGELGLGEWTTLASSLVFAVVIVLIDRWGRWVPPSMLTLGILAGTGLPALALAFAWQTTGSGTANWLESTAALLQQPRILTVTILLTLIPVMTSLWMASFQPRVSPTRAALIYLFEPVFGSLLSLMWGHDEPTARLGLGGALILGGNLVVELPGWLRRRFRA